MAEAKGTRALVVMPTYNERENLRGVVAGVLSSLPSAEIWIVDDSSPDGTGALAEEIAAQNPRVTVFHRPAKRGLGTAYTESFGRALQDGYDYVIEMDADFSHDPRLLPTLLSEAQSADLVLGSRYVPGGSTPDWTFLRRSISRVGNIVARFILGLPVRDATTGYRVYTRSALLALRLEGVKLQGYGFQIETVYQCHRAGLDIREYPIAFVDRRRGRSKMSRAIVAEALVYVFRRRLQEVRLTLAVHQPERVGSHHQPAEGADQSYQSVEPAAPTKTELPVDQLE